MRYKHNRSTRQLSRAEHLKLSATTVLAGLVAVALVPAAGRSMPSWTPSTASPSLVGSATLTPVATRFAAASPARAARPSALREFRVPARAQDPLAALLLPMRVLGFVPAVFAQGAATPGQSPAPKRHSAYNDSSTPLSGQKCSATGDSGPGAGAGKCSVNGSGSGGGEPSCSAHGEGNPGTNDTGQSKCSAEGGNSGGNGTGNCSIQVDSSTSGGGCSAGNNANQIPPQDNECSTYSDSGGTCSATGKVGSSGAKEVDCSAGRTAEGTTASCSTMGGSDEKPNSSQFCSAKTSGTTGKNNAACSAWDMGGSTTGPGSGTVKCSVLSSAGKCSIQGSSGGVPAPPEDGQDGFCTVSSGGWNPGDGDAECSVLVEDSAGQCSTFSGGKFEGPDSQGRCYAKKLVSHKPPQWQK